MNYNQWQPIYQEICTDFSFSEKKDKKSALLLDGILKQNTTHLMPFHFSKKIKHKTVIVFGAGPSLTEGIEKHNDLISDAVLIAADGATTGLVRKHIIPDIIVTDLDGAIHDQINANEQGSYVLIHAHGDNIDTIQLHAPKFSSSIAGSTQNDPNDLSYVFNFGGFTDGDRCVFLSTHFMAKNIFLIGFDFLGPIGRYSLPDKKNEERKYRKLWWAKKLITLLSVDHAITFLD